MKRKDSLARMAMKLLCAFLGLILAAMLGITLLFRNYLEQINYAPSDDLFSRISNHRIYIISC